MGASAVLLFAVPSSPLAQPWSILGGNVVSAVTGVLIFKIFGHSALALGVAVACAILAMSLLRCLHPHGGAVGRPQFVRLDRHRLAVTPIRTGYSRPLARICTAYTVPISVGRWPI